MFIKRVVTSCSSACVKWWMYSVTVTQMDSVLLLRYDWGIYKMAVCKSKRVLGVKSNKQCKI